MASPDPFSRRRRVGVVGFGLLGRYLVEKIVNECSGLLELAFVWNRSHSCVEESEHIPIAARCFDLERVASFAPDIIVEVCHPDITRKWGLHFLSVADLFIGSPTAFADPTVDAALRMACANGPHSIYVPAGALWGAQDISRMSARGALTGLSITMKKHPASLKLSGTLEMLVARLLEDKTPGETVLFEGPVRDLALLSPNNVNTMAAAAVAAPNLGFDGVVARLVRERES